MSNADEERGKWIRRLRDYKHQSLQMLNTDRHDEVIKNTAAGLVADEILSALTEARREERERCGKIVVDVLMHEPRQLELGEEICKRIEQEPKP